MFKADRDKPADTELLLLALENAAKRGVRVRVVFDIENDESSFLNKANRETGTDLAKAGAVVMYDSPKKRLHTKMTVIDRRIVYSGSHNYTYSAFNYNDEVTMRLESESLAAEATEYVEKFFR
jgi:phosphatidylserine/phosphatidylglycerophosphate/cardiolipin synthase-like enzyme